MNQRNHGVTWAAVFTAVLLAGLWQTASAYRPGACRMDAEKLCPGMKDKEAIPCLKQHEAELSMDCKVNLAEARQVVREMKEVCDADVQKFCAGVEQGKGRIRRCLKAHEAELSADCQAQIHAARKKYNIHPSTAAPAAGSTGTN